MTATVIELADGKLKDLDGKKDREKRLKAVKASVKRIKFLASLVDRERRRESRLYDKVLLD